MSTFRLPTTQQHAIVIGMNGSGKSVLGLWMLSEAAITDMPYIIIDFKHEDVVQQIQHARVIGYNDVPKHPGVYILRPDPTEGDKLEEFLRAIWRRGHTGIFYDETAELPKHFGKGAVHAILTQGRSKHIPVIACTQRPRGVAPAFFTEASFFSCFHLQKPADVDAFAAYTPWDPKSIIENPLPPYWSHWYDAKQRWATILRPCPAEDVILETFRERLRPRRHYF
jgi:hypothetical protein